MGGGGGGGWRRAVFLQLSKPSSCLDLNNPYVPKNDEWSRSIQSELETKSSKRWAATTRASKGSVSLPTQDDFVALRKAHAGNALFLWGLPKAAVETGGLTVLVWLDIGLFLFVCLFICLFVCLFVWLAGWLFACLLACLFVFLLVGWLAGWLFVALTS